MIDFLDSSPTKDKWGGTDAKTKSYVTYGVLALVALWLLKKLRIF